MYKKILRLTALLAFLLLLAGACIAGLAAALPDTFYTADAPTALQVASMPYLTAQKKQGSVAADSASPDASANVTLALFGVLPVKTDARRQHTAPHGAGLRHAVRCQTVFRRGSCGCVF